MSGLENGDGQEHAAVASDGQLDHPLAVTSRGDVGERTSVTREDSFHVQYGALLGAEDAERIKECLHALITKCLIPYAERQIRILNELVRVGVS